MDDRLDALDDCATTMCDGCQDLVPEDDLEIFFLRSYARTPDGLDLSPESRIAHICARCLEDRGAPTAIIDGGICWDAVPIFPWSKAASEFPVNHRRARNAARNPKPPSFPALCFRASTNRRASQSGISSSPSAERADRVTGIRRFCSAPRSTGISRRQFQFQKSRKTRRSMTTRPSRGFHFLLANGSTRRSSAEKNRSRSPRSL